MREVDHRHPLIVADVVMDSLVVIGGTKQATCEAGPLTRRFRGELTMFPADYVLAALGRYHLVVVTDENLETLAWECHTLHSFISGQLEGQKALQKEEVLLAEVAGLKKQLELKEAPKITCQLTQEDILKYWEEEKVRQRRITIRPPSALFLLVSWGTQQTTNVRILELLVVRRPVQ